MMRLAGWRRYGALVAALGCAYGAGALTLVLLSGTPASPDPVIAEAERTIVADAVHPVTRGELDRAAVEGMLEALDDRWATYYTPQAFQAFQQSLAGEYSGIGIWVSRGESGPMRVTSVIPGSPAGEAGIHVGDVLVAVGDRPVAGTPVAVVVQELRGAPGTPVSIVVESGTSPRRIELRRAQVVGDDVLAQQIAPGVVMLRVAAFTGGVGSWIHSEVAQLRRSGVRGVVLDLRDDPGGLLDQAVATASAFLDGGPVVAYQRRGGPREIIDAQGAGDTVTPLVVLVNGGTASAAEIVAGALQDRERAVVVGSRTFGKGTIQQSTELTGGSGLELTIGSYFTPDGTSLNGVGLEPDVQVPVSAPPEVAEQRAVEVLSGMVGATGRR